MGFEYKILVDLDTKQVEFLKEVLEKRKDFYRKYLFNNSEFLEFKILKNTSAMPTFSISFEPTGIYLCCFQESISNVDLNDIKTFFDSEGLSFQIIDYEE